MGTILDDMRAKADAMDENGAVAEPIVEEPTEPITEEPSEPAEPVEPTDPVEPVEPIEGEPAAVSEEPVKYEPNHKFTFKDEEFEFDDKVKGFIKSKEDEELFRNFATAQKAQEAYKGFGSLREVETKMGEYDGLVETGQKYKALDTELDTLGGMLQKGNIEQFRAHLGIPKEQLLQWAVKEAQAIEDPAVAQQLQQEYQSQQNDFNLQHQNTLMHNRLEQQEIQGRNAELDMGLGNSEVEKVAHAYDGAVGTPGSFKQAIIDHGTNVFHQTGRDISVTEAVQAVTQKFQGLVKSEAVGTQQDPNTQQINPVNAPALSAQPVVQQQANPEQTVVINQGGKSTIPNIQGGSGTPAKKAIKSLADIRAAAKALD